MPEAAQARPDVVVTVDDREGPSGIADAIAASWRPTEVRRLAVGHVAVGDRVLVERKTVADFVVSVGDGRLFRQAYALHRAAHRPLLVVEGSEATEILGLSAESLRGVLLALMVSYRIPVLRTSDVRDSARWIAHLARLEARRLARTGRPWAPTAGRQALDVLAAIPGVGDARARRLLDAFGSVGAVARASERDLEAVELIGSAVARAIVRAFTSPGPEEEETARGGTTGDPGEGEK